MAVRQAGPTTTHALSFDGVSMVFPNGTHAVQDVSFEVDWKEFVVTVGPSGCGKSTLLRIASGLERASSGKVVVEGSQLGYVFQDPTLLPWRTVQGNVELLGELHGLEKEERRRRAAEAIAMVGLEGFEQNHPKQLSGGMRMRVSLARSLTMDPKVFLFDEPFAALDEITRTRLNDELLRLFTHEGFAGLFVTHSIPEAVYLASRVIVMSGRPGRILGEVSVPFDYPRSPDLRFDPEFAAVAGRVSKLLREAYA
ncbi:MAG: ABC transporter ATP-binding protein [Actinomycetota bacterium]